MFDKCVRHFCIVASFLLASPLCLAMQGNEDPLDNFSANHSDQVQVNLPKSFLYDNKLPLEQAKQLTLLPSGTEIQVHGKMITVKEQKSISEIDALLSQVRTDFAGPLFVYSTTPLLAIESLSSQAQSLLYGCYNTATAETESFLILVVK